jgi:hypothetical protein
MAPIIRQIAKVLSSAYRLIPVEQTCLFRRPVVLKAMDAAVHVARAPFFNLSGQKDVKIKTL